MRTGTVAATVTALGLVATASPARADDCSDRHPGGAPRPTFWHKTRFDVGAGVHDGDPTAGLAIEPIWHPHGDAGLRVDYVHPRDDGISSSVALHVEGRLFAIKSFGGIGSDGVCGMKGRNWHQGAPYLLLGFGALIITDGADPHFSHRVGLGWDMPRGRRLSLFVEGGRAVVTTLDDSWFATLGVRL